ncbi:MAG TPA: penicillin-binding protein 1C [Caulobacteraceae bacterium]|nr:penicillin-binding protein 1C [Caulobacteraceae bacterium]
MVLVGLDAAFPPDLSKAYRSSPVALDKDGGWLRALPVEAGRWRIRADLDRTDPTFVARVVALEDKRFWLHPGVDPVSALRAAASALLHGRITSGASTLTMQTARLLEPRPRTWAAKFFQMARALQLQARLSKRETLALYFTLAPYGGNLEGVRAASLSYFGHEPETLTPGEQALLIALPQSPEARRPDRKPAAARAARDRVLYRMAGAGLITRAEAGEGSSEPLPGARLPLPTLAWQAAGELARAAPLEQASVVSTVDADLQRRLEPMAAALAKTQGPDAEVAILVVEAKNRAVRAAVGSAGLTAPSGWMDMTRALRSPGSALKPFIYGLAMDDGIVAPDTQLDDAPQRFGDYQPEDFDRMFHGPVTMREALIHSLNVPAVATLERLGPETFEARLEGVGARLVRPQSDTRDPGLALALGGEGISLRDIAMLYAAMADDGIAKPLAWTEADAAERLHEGGQRLMRTTSARAILDILRDGPPPKGRAPDALTRVTPMAFKTGTSYGFRDAVAVGVAGGYVIAVWTGRADGGARPDLTGREAALPFLFDVADQVAAQGAAPPPISPRAPPPALRTLEQVNHGPRLIFPPDGASIIADGYGPTSRGLVLAAVGDGLTWYVDGVVVPNDPVSGHPLWRPPGPGFYRISVVDGAGRTVVAHVRVKGG